MSTNVIELTNQALSLPAQDRVQLAQKLWESLEEEVQTPPFAEAETLEIAQRRDSELSSGKDYGVPQEEVMENAWTLFGANVLPPRDQTDRRRSACDSDNP